MCLRVLLRLALPGLWVEVMGCPPSQYTHALTSGVSRKEKHPVILRELWEFTDSRRQLMEQTHWGQDCLAVSTHLQETVRSPPGPITRPQFPKLKSAPGGHVLTTIPYGGSFRS